MTSVVVVTVMMLLLLLLINLTTRDSKAIVANWNDIEHTSMHIVILICWIFHSNLTLSPSHILSFLLVCWVRAPCSLFTQMPLPIILNWWNFNANYNNSNATIDWMYWQVSKYQAEILWNNNNIQYWNLMNFIQKHEHILTVYSKASYSNLNYAASI